MIQNKQSGFSAVEIILVLVVVGIIGFTGWFVWQSKKTTDKTLSNTNGQTSSSVESKKKSNVETAEAKTSQYDTAKWTQTGFNDEQDDAIGVLIKIPDGWKVAVQDNHLIYAANVAGVTYNAGTAAVVEKTTGGKDGAFRFMAFISPVALDAASYQKVGDAKATGFTGTKYVKTIQNTGQGSGSPDGTKEYQYEFKLRNGHYLSVMYAVHPGEADQQQVVDAAVATLDYQGE